MKPRYHRVHNPYQRIGRRGGKMYVHTGGSFFSSLLSGAKKVGRFLLPHAKTILPHLAKEVGPHILTLGASKLGEYGSKHGAPDSLVNLGARAAQHGATALSKIKTKELSPAQKSVKSFVADKTGDLLSSILSQGKDNGNLAGIEAAGIANFGGSHHTSLKKKHKGKGALSAFGDTGYGISNFGFGEGIANFGSYGTGRKKQTRRRGGNLIVQDAQHVNPQ